MAETTGFKSGFVGIVGPTNSGKSTLLNALVGQKVSIVSSKVQTTYHRVSGVLHGRNEQIVFVDTPGFQRYEERVARLLNKVADRGAQSCDLVAWVFDASAGRAADQVLRLKDKIETMGKPGGRFCLLNKVDKVKDKRELLPVLQRIHEMKLFDEIIPVSALKRDGLDRFLEAVRARLAEGPRYFPEEQVTDRPEQFMVTELIREKIYRSTQEEIPYSVRIEIEKWDTSTKVPTIYAVIHVDSPSRKGILIGKGGSMLKHIGTEARQEIESLLGYHIGLKLFVNVEDEWKKNDRVVNEYLELNS